MKNRTNILKISRKPLLGIILLCAILSLSGCTHLDGDIGDWFGSWLLEEMLIDGEIDQNYANNKEIDYRQVMVSFQGKIFNMAYLGNREIYGSWSYAGDILTLIATYHAGNGYEAPEDFNPFPTVMHFPPNLEELEITVTSIDRRTMQWQFIDPQGQFITYNFQKYP